MASIILASFNAQAEVDILNIGDFDKADTKIIVGFGSYHFGSEEHKYLNESNPSIGLEMWDIQAVYVSANSWNEKSLYLTYAPDYKVNEYLTLTGNIGMATGYKCSNRVDVGDQYMPIEYCSNSGVVFLPAVTVEYHPLANDFALNVSIAPTVAMFSASYDF